MSQVSVMSNKRRQPRQRTAILLWRWLVTLFRHHTWDGFVKAERKT